MLQKLLNKYEVKNVQELVSTVSKRFSRIKTPEKDVAEQLKNKTLNSKKAEIEQIFKANRLSHLLNYEYYDEVVGIFQTSRSYGFILEATTLTGISDKTDDILKGLYTIGIPEGACLQFVLQASSELDNIFGNWKDIRKQDPLYQTIVDERIKFYKTGTKHKLFDKNKIIVRNFRLFITFTFEGAYDSNSAQFLDNIRNAARSILKSQFIETNLVTPSVLINFVREIVCARQDGLEWVEYDSRMSIRDQIADPDNNIYVDTDGIVINDTCVRSLSVRRYPTEPRLHTMNQIIGDDMSTMLQISYPFLLCCNIQILNAEKTNGIMQLEAERTAKQSKNGMGRILPIVDKKAHEYQLMKQLLSEGEGFVNMSHYLHIFTPLGKSEEAFQEAQAVYRSKGWELVNNSNIQLPTILCSLPLFHDPISAKEQSDFRMMKLYSQTNSVNLLPICSDWKGTGTPMLMMLGRRGQIQYIDMFDNKSGNYNVSVVAASGSGKSFVANEIVVTNVSCGSLVRVIDVGGSYKNSCDLLGGQYIEFSEQQKICVNPFTFIGGADGANLQKLEFSDLLKREDLKEQVEMLKAIIMAAAGRDPTDKTEDSFVEQAILQAIHHKGNKSTFTTVYDELLQINDDKGRARDIADSIKSYTSHGIHGEYFEGDSTLDFNNNFIVLELENLKAKGQLVFVILLIVMLKISQEMYLGDRSQRKLCIVDEAWDLMGKGNSGAFIETGYRRARKYNGLFMTITQSIDDYYLSNTTLACWNNADIRLLLRQGTKAKNNTFDEYTTRLLESVTTEAGCYSEMVIQVGGNTCGVSRFIVDPFSTYIYSSNANDVRFVNYIKENEKIPVEQAVRKAMLICNDFMSKFRMDRSQVSAAIVPQIRDKGYQNFMQQLGYV
ncbi:MAG: type IV secretion system protein TraC [Burkholderiales bacterium]|nr:type IV secretion system protein TraC [Burkholderiales bacterium]